MPETPSPQAQIRLAESSEDIATARILFEEYQQSLDIDLCFQNFAQELESLPGEYATPSGALVLAVIDGEAAGCVAIRPLINSDYPNACEMKRLFVRRAFRGFGLGRLLAERAMEIALQAGYASVLLDTLDEMEAARALYEDLGFVEIAPYYHNPLPGAHYLKADLHGRSLFRP